MVLDNITYIKPQEQGDNMLRHISTCGLKSNDRSSGDTPIIHLLKRNQSFCKVSPSNLSVLTYIPTWAISHLDLTHLRTFLQLAPKWKCLKGTNWSKQEGPYALKLCITWKKDAGNVFTSIQVHCWSRPRVPSLAKLCLSSPPSSNHLSKHRQSIQLISSALSRITHLR